MRAPAKWMLGAAGTGLLMVIYKIVDYLKANLDRIELSATWFFLFYAISGTIVFLWYTGWLREHNCEWLVVALAILVFPAIIYL